MFVYRHIEIRPFFFYDIGTVRQISCIRRKFVYGLRACVIVYKTDFLITRASLLLIGRLRSPAPYLGGQPAARGAYIGNFGYQQPVTYGYQQGLMYSPYGWATSFNIIFIWCFYSWYCSLFVDSSIMICTCIVGIPSICNMMRSCWLSN